MVPLVQKTAVVFHSDSLAAVQPGLFQFRSAGHHGANSPNRGREQIHHPVIIVGIENQIAYVVSRDEMPRFFHLCPNAQPAPETIPPLMDQIQVMFASQPTQ